MDADGLPIVGTGINFTKVGAIHQKRTLAFLNHFVSHTVRFLNRFSCVCEEKLERLTVRLQRLETTMNILEAKLSSIPGLEDVTVPIQDPTTLAEPASSGIKTPGSQPRNTPDPAPTPEPTKPEEVPEEKPKLTVSQDPRYMKYFKMLAVGVPAAALRLKMAGEGLDPNLLDNPNAPVPDAQSPTKESDTEFSSEENQASSDNDDDSSGFSD